MNDADQAILDCFDLTRSKTIELLHRTPADWLTRQAEGERHTAGWLYLHIADSPDWWLNFCMKDGRGRAYPAGDASDAASILAALESSQRRLREFFTTGGGARLAQVFGLDPRTLPNPEDGPIEQFTGRNRVQYLTAHEVHHRGKLVLALRQWGLKDIPFLPF